MRRWLGSEDERRASEVQPDSRPREVPVESELHAEIGGRLQEIISTLKSACRYAPRDADDILQTERILSEGLGLPLPLVWQIIEDAGYWIRSLGRCGNLLVTAFGAEVQESLCCTATIPPYVKSYKPLRRVVFTIESHDQGWRTSDDGGSWTWFEVGGKIASRRHLVHNIPASRDYHTHRIQWDNALHDDSPADGQLLEWMSSIAGRQELSVFARAQFGGWANHVRKVSIEVYCACV
ncbi:hypothetical protein FOMPIDRAFT_1025698 [Fomitopsis schrenkii]|uniref:Uncharacterized protein n=1 Tax=Fomitopsis schrenkii TaxID=2126942 RepID=S8DQS2_FOMSC|nr:hypothetical protein FOMPIDRAFT_1025698 [Fomitopsis schrenkii]